MGSHKTQTEKLEALREQLSNGDKIMNRDIRAAFGKEDYKAYEHKLENTRRDNDKRKATPKRTGAQQRAEKAIKQCYMLIERAVVNGDVGNDAIDKWLDIAQERFEELTGDERLEFNPAIFSYNSETKQIQLHIVYGDVSVNFPPIYQSPNPPLPITELKNRALSEAVQEKLVVLKKEDKEREAAYALTDEQSAALRAKLVKLRKR